MKTFAASIKDIERKWFVIDACNMVLGRLSTRIAVILRGKNKVKYSPNIDLGDYVIVINSRKIIVTGNKMKNKFYHHHTGYIGGLKSISFSQSLIKDPTLAIKKSVKGMLPRNILGREMYSKLKVYPDDKHPHIAQNPQLLKII